MRSLTSMVLIALYAALSQTTLAAPLPVSTTLFARPVTYSYSRNLISPFSRSMRIMRNLNMTSSSLPTTSTGDLAATSTTNSPADPYSQFATFHQKAKQSCKELKKLAVQSGSDKANDGAFQTKCKAQLNDFHSNVLGQQAALAAITNEKRKTARSVPNFDPSNALEVLVKETVVDSKKTLKYIDILTGNLPIVGPLVEPIVYDTKCLVDAALDYTENLTDGIINGLPPAVKNLLG